MKVVHNFIMHKGINVSGLWLNTYLISETFVSCYSIVYIGETLQLFFLLIFIRPQIYQLRIEPELIIDVFSLAILKRQSNWVLCFQK